jgi:hypothetical protein
MWDKNIRNSMFWTAPFQKADRQNNENRKYPKHVKPRLARVANAIV